MRPSDTYPTSATWGARFGNSARRDLRGGTGTRGQPSRLVSTHHSIDHEWMLRFLEHRIADRRVLRLIRKWLKVGVLEDGRRVAATVGTPQGAVISPLLANITLHYVLDLWARQWRQRHATGQVIMVRYADDSVYGFEHKADAERFLAEMRERMERFGLALHPDKTRLIEFGRHAIKNRKQRGDKRPETFDFLGSRTVAARPARADSRYFGSR